MQLKKIPLFLSWVKIWNAIFNPTFGFVHILPKFGSKQPSIVISEGSHDTENWSNNIENSALDYREKKKVF